jgi:cytochrome o ubiquinol oxidase subunit 3
MGAKSNSVGMAVFWMLVTLVLGAGFVGMGFHQLASLVQHGYTWRTSAFLSIFFLIIAIHAVHYVVAMFWSLVLLVQFPLQGMSDRMKTRMACLGLFFNFLNLMWVFIFTVVFLLGAV